MAAAVVEVVPIHARDRREHTGRVAALRLSAHLRDPGPKLLAPPLVSPVGLLEPLAAQRIAHAEPRRLVALQEAWLGVGLGVG